MKSPTTRRRPERSNGYSAFRDPCTCESCCAAMPWRRELRDRERADVRRKFHLVERREES